MFGRKARKIRELEARIEFLQLEKAGLVQRVRELRQELGYPEFHGRHLKKVGEQLHRPERKEYRNVPGERRYRKGTTQPPVYHDPSGLGGVGVILGMWPTVEKPTPDPASEAQTEGGGGAFGGGGASGSWDADTPDTPTDVPDSTPTGE